MDKFLKFCHIKCISAHIGIRDIIPWAYLTAQRRKWLLKRIIHIICRLPCIRAACYNSADSFWLFNRRIWATHIANDKVTLKAVQNRLNRSRKEIIIHRSKECYVIGILKILKKYIQIFIRAPVVIFAPFAIGARWRSKLVAVKKLNFAIKKVFTNLIDKLLTYPVLAERAHNNQQFYHYNSKENTKE